MSCMRYPYLRNETKKIPGTIGEDIPQNCCLFVSQMNDGPLCKCSAKAKRTGIRHSIYPGEEVRPIC